MDEIVVAGLTKRFRAVQAVDGVSFAIRKGEVFGLLGPNGAGKSTTVRVLATLTRADGGRATVAGHDVAADPAGARRTFGYVAQASGVDKWATGRENLTLQAQLQRVPPADVAPRVAELLDWVALSDAAARLVNTYSGGMKRRLDIAMGLVHRPRVLFLDEPTTGLDPETRRALWTDLARLRAAGGLTVLLTTHYLEEADTLCDRIAIVDHGRVVALGTPAELKGQIGGDRVTLTLADGTTRVTHAADGAAALPRVLAEAAAAGIAVASATVTRPSLDDVYLHHTGHRFDSTDATAGRGGWG
jgi:ABC-2 type transport system ATP-binding protein